jgi:ribosomal-protein-alanine N-acetyltransferase
VILLETERLLFRDHEPADLDAYCSMEADPEVRRYVGGAPRSREEAERRFKKGLDRPAENRLWMWGTVHKPDGLYIGRCGVYPHFGPRGPIVGEGSIAFYLARSHWGRGLATEAGREFVKFAFDELRLSRLVTSIDTRNAASVRVIEKLGFTLESTEQGESRSFYHYELKNQASAADERR